MCQIILLLISSIFIGTSTAIPKLLQPCYENDFNLNQPQTIQALVQLIQKLESNSTLNARVLSASLLHSVILDGIQKSDHVGLGLPFRATGTSFYKYKLLVDYLTSGESSLFPHEALTSSELCFLHMVLSNTIDLKYRGDESATCKHQSIELVEFQESDVSSCPIKKGIVYSSWGSVAGGHLIKAIASGLEPVRASLKTIGKAVDKNFDTLIDRTVDNVWVATIAGDLAGVVLDQLSNLSKIGVTGFWNDTLFPTVYYLDDVNWDLSEAEILGGVDGVIIAKFLQQDVSKDIRLSQLIDMFYSNRGIVGLADFKITRRFETFQKILNEINLEEQVVMALKLLQSVGTYDVLLNEASILQFSKLVVNQFKSVAENITKKYDNVESIHDVQMKSALEIIIIVTGIYDGYILKQIILGILESSQDCQIGIISGNWLVNITNDQFKLFAELEEIDWPVAMLLHESLETVTYHYQNNSCLKQPIGRAVVIVNQNFDLTINDLKKSRDCLETIKESKPETSFLFVTSKKPPFPFKENYYMIDDFSSIQTLIHDILQVLVQIPGSFVNFFCDELPHKLEDFVVPGIDRWFEIRKEYLMVTPISTKFSTSQNGVSICGYTKRNEICKGVTVNDEISFNSEELCTSEVACNIEFQIFANTSDICAENSCRYPDQVRLNIVWQRSSGYVPVVLYDLFVINLLSLLII